VLLVVAGGLALLHWHRAVPLLRDYRNGDPPYRVAIDSEFYLAMAAGDVAHVNAPVSRRWLHPFLARQVAAVTRLSLPGSLLAVTAAALALLAYALAACLDLTIGMPLPAVPFLLTPLVLEGLEMAYLSDLFHAALLCLLFLLLLRRRHAWALLVLF